MDFVAGLLIGLLIGAIMLLALTKNYARIMHQASKEGIVLTVWDRDYAVIRLGDSND